TEPRGPVVGHGTLSLQQMASSRPVAATEPPIAPTYEPRLSWRSTIAVFLGALLLVGGGVFLYRQGIFDVKASPKKLPDTVTFAQPTYSVDVPINWISQPLQGLDADASYLVADAEPLSVVIDDFDGNKLDSSAPRNAQLGFISGLVSALVNPNAQLVKG